ncbi:ATP-dependent helicase [Anaeromicropila herbilytica]|uniref:DNA 3'-5' helicase n=1 Tax=Anaeromicropila herbilytica TaxID=2785025 RepID=A0A7R7EMN9_9FIRM|nr:ATP-dependent helicase [Anaeromicropila herbilytica]BCN31629.1 hypothetical protein bsdtb5_29240 [Anaeromicropila herbilytica]
MDYKKELDKLTDNQREAVFDESNVCLVNANVGSGKTTVLISKIIYLHYVKQIDYCDMVVLTFTNKAANEIKERLTMLEENLNMEDLRFFGTFHSVALYLLRELLMVDQLGYQKDFFVIEPDEEVDIALRIIQEEKLKIKYKNRLKKRLEQERVSRYQDDLIELRERLQKEKVSQNKMTFSDLLLNTVHLLKEASITPKWVIIDEVQDSDKMQLEFIDALMNKNTRIFAVGDPNQVIYSWRGSAFNVFYTLKDRYQARELSLSVNFRSNISILEVAKCFLQNGGRLTGNRERGNKIIVKRQYDSFQEACYLADRIKEIHDTGIPYKEIAIFYRLQNQSTILENVFSKNGIPFDVSLKKTIQDIPVLNWTMKLLRFAMNEKDISSGIYVLSHKDYGERITEKAAAKLLKGCSDMSHLNHGDMFSIDLNFAEKEDFFEESLLQRMLSFRKRFSKVEIPEVDEIYQYFSFDTHLHPTAASYQEDKELVKELLRTLITYINEHKMSFLEGLQDFINSSSLYGVNILNKDINNEADTVKLMTLHASKGLEFSYVFIIGVNNGLIPLQAKSFEEEDEERRLLFVGITRAKDNLELSYYTNPDTYRTMAGESRFIRMIPKHLIESDDIERESVNLQELKRQILAEKNVKMDMIKNSDNSTKTLLEDNEVDVEDNQVEDSEVQVEKMNEEVEVREIHSTHNGNELLTPNELPVRKVSHAKYGIGTVTREDDLMITVLFKAYGKKEFMKAFSELKEE